MAEAKCRICNREERYDDWVVQCPHGWEIRGYGDGAFFVCVGCIEPQRFRYPAPEGKHPTGRDVPYLYGCYFPSTDLVIYEMGQRGTGKPSSSGIEWLDGPDVPEIKV